MAADLLTVNCLFADGAGTNGSTSTGPTDRDIQPGEYVVVWVGSSGGSTLPTAVSVGSLNLTLDKAMPITNTGGWVFSALATDLIASGSNVSVTMNGTFRDIGCLSLTGIGATPLNQSANNAGSGATPDSGTTPATTIADAIALAFWRGTTQLANPVTPGAGYTEVPGSDVVSVSGGHAQQLEYKVLTSTGPQQAFWTPSASPTYDALIVVYAGDATSEETISVQYARSAGPVGPF